MNNPEDPARTKRRIVAILAAIIVLGGVLVAAAGFGLYRLVTSADFVKMADQQFGDQHLKTAVALIELHKVRTGRYPRNLAELRFVGEWDTIAIQNVSYRAAADGSSYFVEVRRGWMGKPELHLPPEFWHGTGYNPALAQPETKSRVSDPAADSDKAGSSRDAGGSP